MTVGVLNVVDSEWTVATYAAHNEAMRIADRDHSESMRLSDVAHNEVLRAADDRRYAEVNVEKEKALLIKTTADDEAMRLARESQVYKDQQTDVMREKNLAASGVYATNADLAAIVTNTNASLAAVVDKIEKSLKPVFEFVSAQQGIDRGATQTTNKLNDNIGLIIALIGVAFLVINKFF